MIRDYMQYLPILFLPLPIFALVKLGSSARRLAKQTKKLSTALVQFGTQNHSVVSEITSQKTMNLIEATKARKKYILQRKKSQQDKQRRLVKRLRGMASKESE